MLCVTEPAPGSVERNEARRTQAAPGRHLLVKYCIGMNWLMFQSQPAIHHDLEDGMLIKANTFTTYYVHEFWVDETAR